jgi:hypothetical protein
MYSLDNYSFVCVLPHSIEENHFIHMFSFVKLARFHFHLFSNVQYYFRFLCYPLYHLNTLNSSSAYF